MPVLAIASASRPPSSTQARLLLERPLRAVSPTVNPDFENLYPSVRQWWVEVDDSGIPQREIGFAEPSVAVVAGPLGGNAGFWTDSTVVFNRKEHEAVEEAAFEEAWSRFESSWWACRAGKPDA
jgi:hypothetical protein